LHLALVRVPFRFFAAQHNLTGAREDTVLCLRSVLMKPEHRNWLGRIWAILAGVADGALSR